MTRRPAILAVLLAALAAPAGAQVTEPREGVSFFDTGPLRIEEQFLLSVGFLDLAPSSAGILERGSWQVDLVQSVTNNWSADCATRWSGEPADGLPPPGGGGSLDRGDL